MVPPTHPVSVQAMPDDSFLTVDAYNELLYDTNIVSSRVMEETAGLRATHATRKKLAIATAKASTPSASSEHG